MRLADWFSTFCSNIQVKDGGIISTRFKAITRRLNTDYWETTSDTSHSLYAGSYGRNTAIEIRALVRLTTEEEIGLTASDIKRFGITVYHEPVRDYTAPTQEQIERVIDFIGKILASGKAIAVSCGAGCGRTGTVLACYLVSKGLHAWAAVDKLITLRPCSREILSVPDFEEEVLEFHR